VAITVTATPGTGTSGALLRVLVLTGATAAGGANSTTTSTTTGGWSLTPSGSNSYPVWAVTDYSAQNAFTSRTNNTLRDNFDATSGMYLATGNYSGTVTGGTPVTVGATLHSGDSCFGAAYEILASGGTTPALDGSSPVAVSEPTGATALTTASFTPPAGSVVVAICTAANFPSTAWSVSDSSSMTWTSRASNGSSMAIFTATVPSGGAAAPIIPPRGPARARFPLSRRGRSQGNQGTFSGTGPPIVPPKGPAGLGRRAPGPFRQGRSQGNAGAPVTNPPPQAGPPIIPPGGPAGLARRAPGPARKGRSQGSPGIAGGTGPPIVPPKGPAGLGRIAPGPFRKGRAAGNPGGPVVVPTPGPPIIPPRGPAGLAWRAPGPRRKGRAQGNPGGPVTPPPAVNVINTWTASRQLTGSGTQPGAPMNASLDCPVASGSTGTWLIAFCSWTLPPGFLGATMEVADDVHGFWIPLGAPNGDTSASGFTRSSIWARPGGSSSNPVPGANHVYVAPAGMPGPVYPSVIGVTVIEVSGMSPYAGIPAVVPVSSNGASSISANAPAPTSQALMVTVAASDAAAFSSGPGGSWTALTGVNVSGTAPVILHTSPAWQVASTAQAASWGTGTSGDLSACTAVILTSNPAPAQPNPAWPYTQLQCAFGSGALTPRSQMTWTDISSRFLAGQETSAQRGKNRQLDQVQAAQISLTLDNKDSALDPGNTLSPFYPNVVADTPIRLLMTWQGRTYSQFSGYVAKWPQQWKSGTRQGLAAVTVTDAWSLLIDQLACVQQSEILLTGPYAYWTAGDAAGSAYAANFAPGNSNALIVTESKTGALTAVADFGADSGVVAGDPDGTLWSQSGLASGDNGYGYALICADENYPPVSAGNTVMGWFNPVGGAVQVSANLCLMRGTNAATGAMWQVDIINPAGGTNPGGIQVTVWDKVTRVATNTTVSTQDWCTAGLFHVAMVLSQSTWVLYLNGAQVGSGTCNLAAGMSWLSFMGTADRFSTGGMLNGECGHLAVFGVELPADRIASIFWAGTPNPLVTPGVPPVDVTETAAQFAMEYASQRIERLMGYGGWSGPRALSTTSTTEMAGITDIQGTAGSISASKVVTAGQGQQAGEAVTNIVASDNGFMQVDGNGVLCYQSRGDFYGRSPQWFVGELTGQPLNRNWALVSGVSPWTAFGGSATFTPGGSLNYLGYQSGLLTPDGVTADPGIQSELITVTALTSYLASAVIASAAGFSAGVIAQVQWYNSSSVLIGTSTGTAVPIAAAGSGTLVSVQATAPGGAVSAYAMFYTNGTPSAATTFSVALPMLQPAATAGTAGEYPAESDVTFSEDKALLYNTAQLTQSTGTGVAITAENQPSALQHGQSPFTATVYQYDPNVVGDEANWIVETQGTPVNRFETFSVNAGKNAANWPFVLGVEPGMALQAARRPVTAQSPTVVAGITAQVTRKFDFLSGTAMATPTGDTFPEEYVLSADDPLLGQLNGVNRLAW
jgi:hypothetical protein